MNEYFIQLFDILNYRENYIVIMVVYLFLIAAAALLRIAAATAFRSSLFTFKLDAKDINSREDIKKIKNAALRKVAAEYIRVAEKSVSRIPASALVARQVDSLSLFGWRYGSVMPFVESMETGLVLIGVIFALAFGEYAFMFGTLAAGGFALMKIISAFFNFREARNRYFDEMLIYVEREIGHYYAADSGGAVLRLKNDLTEAVNKQSAVLKEAVETIGASLASAVEKQLKTAGEALRGTADDWGKSVSETEKIQASINASADKMQIAVSSLVSASDLLSRHLNGHSNALTEQLSSLVSAVGAVAENSSQLARERDTVMSQLQFIEKNQQSLENAVQSFEAILQDITKTLGDGYGAFLKLHAETAAKNVNDALSANVERISLSNMDVIRQNQSLFEQLKAQSREISANLLSLHEKLSSNGASIG
jgi:hypothetical protein